MGHNLLSERDLESLEVSSRTRSSKAGSATDEIRGPFPEVRIVRRVDWRESENWNDFLNEFGEQNLGKGKVVALGSMACTVVSAQEMGKMFRERYGNKIFFDRSNVLGKMRRFSKLFNKFVADQVQLAVDLRADMADAQPNPAPYEPQFEGDDGSSLIDLGASAGSLEALLTRDVEDESSLPYSVWEPLAVAVKGVDKYSRNAFGADLSGDRALASSDSHIMDYLRYEGLGTHHVDRGRTRHIVFFESFPHITLGHLAMKNNLQIPADVVLHPPQAMVNPNGNIE